MSLIEQTLFGTIDKVQMAIDRIKTFEPEYPDFYKGYTSFGKDSVVLMHLTKMAGVRVKWFHSLTTLDPPELIKFGRGAYPEVEIMKPPIPMLKLLETKGFPTHRGAWCCDLYKERYGTGTILLGIRSEESGTRSHRKIREQMKKNKTIINPILDFTFLDVWDTIEKYKIPYCQLYTEMDRIGCVMCPKAATGNRKWEEKRWPGFAKAYKRSFARLYENKKHRDSYKRWKSWQEMYDWWMSEQQKQFDPDQTVMFE